MKKYKVFLYGICIGFAVCTLYSVYIYLSNPEWGGLTSIASFMVLFPLSILVSLVVQIVVLFYSKRTR